MLQANKLSKEIGSKTCFPFEQINAVFEDRWKTIQLFNDHIKG